MKEGFMFVTGLLLTLGGVGGIENSITDSELLSAVAVAVVGLGIFGCSALMIQQKELDNQI